MRELLSGSPAPRSILAKLEKLTPMTDESLRMLKPSASRFFFSASMSFCVSRSMICGVRMIQLDTS